MMGMNRRDVLSWSLKLGALGLTSLLPAPLQAMIKPGMRSVSGDVKINGKRSMMGDVALPGDTITTGPDGQTTLISGFNAYLIRNDSEIMLPEDMGTKKVLSVISGQLLAVFGTEKLSIDTPLATIGIRGTGIYIEAWKDRDYVCLCYGRADLLPKLEPAYYEKLDTFHHNAPRNFYADPDAHDGRFIEPAPMVNHTDEELIMLEALTGRIPLFGPKPIKMPSPK